VAGAAMALRGLGQPYPALADYLLKAIQNIRHADDAISFETYKPRWPLEKHTNGLTEIFATFEWMGAYAAHSITTLTLMKDDPYFSSAIKNSIVKAIEAISNAPTVAVDDCCSTMPSHDSPYRSKVNKQSLAKISLKDQEGDYYTYNSFFEDKPSLVLFFYTRCDNPIRCSLNITRMALLQQELKKQGLYGKINLAVVSYDPAYDLPMRIKPYCTNRGLMFDEYTKGFMVDKGMDILLSHLEPGVNYNGALLNHHTSELFLLNDKGKSFTRIPGIEWDNKKIIEKVEKLGKKNSKPLLSIKHVLNNIASVFFSFLLIFFPKCPFCAAAYLSMFGISTYDFFRIKAWAFPLFISFLLLNLFALFWMGRKRKWHLPFYLSLLGAVCILLSVFAEEKTWVKYVGMGLVIISSLLNGLSGIMQIKTRSFFFSLPISKLFQKNHFSYHKPFKL
jgi:protein SCO1/2